MVFYFYLIQSLNWIISALRTTVSIKKNKKAFNLENNKYLINATAFVCNYKE